MHKILALAFAVLLLAVPFAAAETFSRIDPRALPAYYIYDPVRQDNAVATTYSYERLVALLDNPKFRRWNDIEDVCMDIVLMFGRSAPRCAGIALVVPSTVRPVTVRAYVDPYVPPPVHVHVPRVVWTDPVYYPWAPTFEPYPHP